MSEGEISLFQASQASIEWLPKIILKDFHNTWSPRAYYIRNFQDAVYWEAAGRALVQGPLYRRLERNKREQWRELWVVLSNAELWLFPMPPHGQEQADQASPHPGCRFDLNLTSSKPLQFIDSTSFSLLFDVLDGAESTRREVFRARSAYEAKRWMLSLSKIFHQRLSAASPHLKLDEASILPDEQLSTSRIVELERDIAQAEGALSQRSFSLAARDEDFLTTLQGKHHRKGWTDYLEHHNLLSLHWAWAHLLDYSTAERARLPPHELLRWTTSLFFSFSSPQSPQYILNLLSLSDSLLKQHGDLAYRIDGPSSPSLSPSLSPSDASALIESCHAFFRELLGAISRRLLDIFAQNYCASRSFRDLRLALYRSAQPFRRKADTPSLSPFCDTPLPDPSSSLRPPPRWWGGSRSERKEGQGNEGKNGDAERNHQAAAASVDTQKEASSTSSLSTEELEELLSLRRQWLQKSAFDFDANEMPGFWWRRQASSAEVKELFAAALPPAQEWQQVVNVTKVSSSPDLQQGTSTDKREKEGFKSAHILRLESYRHYLFSQPPSPLDNVFATQVQEPARLVAYSLMSLLCIPREERRDTGSARRLSLSSLSPGSRIFSVRLDGEGSLSLQHQQLIDTSLLDMTDSSVTLQKSHENSSGDNSALSPSEKYYHSQTLSPAMRQQVDESMEQFCIAPQRVLVLCTVSLDQPRLFLLDLVTSSPLACFRLGEALRIGPDPQLVQAFELLDSEGHRWRLTPEAGVGNDMEQRELVRSWLQTLWAVCASTVPTPVHTSIKAGVLMKRGKLNKSFKPRWFELSSDLKLRYFSLDAHLTYKGQIDLILLDRFTMGKRDDIARFEDQLCLSMQRIKRVWMLKASKDVEAEDWLTVISDLLLLWGHKRPSRNVAEHSSERKVGSGVDDAQEASSDDESS